MSGGHWKFHVFETTSGRLLEPLPAVQFSWSTKIGDSNIQGAIDKKAIQRQSLVWKYEALPHDMTAADLNALLMPDNHGLLISYDDRPWLWGIIGQREDTFVDTSFPTNGIMTLLAGRKLTDLWDTWSAKGASWQQSGVSLGTIAKRMVQTALNKPGGYLPITFDDDEVTANLPGHNATYHERTHPPYDIANLTVSDLLKNISNVDGGPDIDFRPYVQDGIVYQHMHFGTEANPNIAQLTDLVFPVGPNSSAVSDFKQTVSADYRADRIYATGAGQDEGTLTAKAEDLTLVQTGWPLKEASTSSTSVTAQSTLDSTAAGALSPYPAAQWQLVVRADYELHPLGTYWPGDEVTVPIHGHRMVPDGVYRARIMEISGTEGADVTLKLSAFSAIF